MAVGLGKPRAGGKNKSANQKTDDQFSAWTAAPAR